eukprot:1154955-Pelagomonas_calceolata.AAC.9
MDRCMVHGHPWWAGHRQKLQHHVSSRAELAPFGKLACCKCPPMRWLVKGWQGYSAAMDLAEATDREMEMGFIGPAMLSSCTPPRTSAASSAGRGGSGTRRP